MAQLQGLDTYLIFPQGLSAPCCVASSTPIPNVAVKLRHIFQSGIPGFLKLQLFGTAVKNRHNTWSKNNQLFVADQVLALISHTVL